MLFLVLPCSFGVIMMQFLSSGGDNAAGSSGKGLHVKERVRNKKGRSIKAVLLRVSVPMLNLSAQTCALESVSEI